MSHWYRRCVAWARGWLRCWTRGGLDCRWSLRALQLFYKRLATPGRHVRRLVIVIKRPLSRHDAYLHILLHWQSFYESKALGIWALTHLPPVGDSPHGAERKRPDNALFWRHVYQARLSPSSRWRRERRPCQQPSPGRRRRSSRPARHQPRGWRRPRGSHHRHQRPQSQSRPAQSSTPAQR